MVGGGSIPILDLLPIEKSPSLLLLPNAFSISLSCALFLLRLRFPRNILLQSDLLVSPPPSSSSCSSAIASGTADARADAAVSEVGIGGRDNRVRQ